MGNKNEDPTRRIVLESDARQFADTMHIKFFETSAKENSNVEEVSTIQISPVSAQPNIRTRGHNGNSKYVPFIGAGYTSTSFLVGKRSKRKPMFIK